MKIRNLVKKTLLITAAGAFAMALFTGCKKADNKVVDIKVISDKLLNEITYEDQLSEVDYDIVYNMDDIKVSKSIVYVGSGATAEEIAVIECESKEEAKKAFAALNERVEDQKESFKDYVPKELKKLDEAVVMQKGNSVILSVSNDSKKAIDIIEKAE
jgi:hypothetical protein